MFVCEYVRQVVRAYIRKHTKPHKPSRGKTSTGHVRCTEQKRHMLWQATPSVIETDTFATMRSHRGRERLQYDRPTILTFNPRHHHSRRYSTPLHPTPPHFVP